MAENGDIYLDNYSAGYSVRRRGLLRREETVVGEGTMLRRGLQGSPGRMGRGEQLFLRLPPIRTSSSRSREQPRFIGPDSRKNEVVSFVKGGLRDLSDLAHHLDWGVKAGRIIPSTSCMSGSTH